MSLRGIFTFVKPFYTYIVLVYKTTSIFAVNSKSPIVMLTLQLPSISKRYAIIPSRISYYAKFMKITAKHSNFSRNKTTKRERAFRSLFSMVPYAKINIIKLNYYIKLPSYKAMRIVPNLCKANKQSEEFIFNKITQHDEELYIFIYALHCRIQFMSAGTHIHIASR